jgi:hypothetical protein
MITSENKKYIMELVGKLTPTILEEINFDPTIKEPGHSFHGPFEDLMVKKLIEFDSDFSEPTEIRSSDDIKYKGHYINIKFGYDKNGQPNICSMKRLFKYLHEGTIDSYYILSVDAKGPRYHFFDVYDYLDYTNFNYGTGQLMLCESKLNGNYTFNEEINPLSKSEKIFKIGNMMKVECERHISLKKKQQETINKIVNGYKESSSLF